MKKRIVQYTIILIFALSPTVIYAQDNRTMETKVADILAQMPTNDLIYLDRVMAEIVELGPEGFQKMADMLTPAGVGDDTAVRFAINSLARYASNFGMETERSFVETVLLEAIQQQTNTEVLTFLINQLNLVGGQRSCEALQIYLADKDLAEPATQALLSIGNKEAALALLSGLSKADEKTRVTLVRALGQLNCKTALPEITRLADSGKPELKKVSLEALAKIGDPVSYKLLFNAAKAVDFNYEPTNAAENFLDYVNSLAENNELKLSKNALKEAFKANSAKSKLHNYSKALAIYTRHFGYEALPLLISSMDNSNKPFRYAALNLAEDLGGIAATRKWIEKATTVNDTVKAEIISMLGRRGDEVALDFVKSNLDASFPMLREEAITAMVKLQEKEAIPALIAHLAAGNDLEASKNALNQLLDKKHLAPVANQLDKTKGEVKAAFVALISAKSGSQYFNEIYALTDSNNEDERLAAFAALQNVSSYDHIKKLIDKLLAVQTEDEIALVQTAIVAAVKDANIERTENGQLLQALGNTNKNERIIAILPEVGGNAALQTAVDYFENSSGKLKETAFEALTNWKDYSAATSLYEIIKTASGKYREQAFLNFIRQVRSTSLPDDQKLLQYRKIMPYAATVIEKQRVIESIGNLKTFLSIIYLEDFLNDSELQQTAARSIMRIALPDNNGQNGFAGEIVSDLLSRVASVLKGEESEYEIIRIKNYLAEMPDEKGFVPMFNGKNLDGWQGTIAGGNPLKIAEMSDEERTKAQQEADKAMFENWKVEDGIIEFSGQGGNLVSEKVYSDFELIVDWRISKEGDSGIYLRGTPQIQIWDTSRVEVGAQVGSGGLYNNNDDNIRNPLKVADNPINEWNTFHIKMIGENVTVYLNGELVVDNVRMDNYWDRSIPIFESGTIELQAHGNELAFRNIYIKEINTDEIGLTEEEKAEGFVSLFNGSNLDGWQGNKTDYYAENGELVVNPKRGGRGNLYTEKEYSDFIFRFEFQLTPGANNGLGVRAPLEGDAAYVGMELQILDNTAPIYANLREYQYHGSVYGVIPAKRGFLKPVGEWNYQEVVLKGNDIKITLNGKVILEGNLEEASKNGTLDGRSHPGLDRKTGFIGFLGHGSPLKFRNIRINDLANTAGGFDIENDLLLLQCDFKPDVDDLQTVAAFATLLHDTRYSKINAHAVAGTYGIQKALYIPPNPLFQLAFGDNWTDAHKDLEAAVEKVKNMIKTTLANQGDIWISEAGQSDFTARLIKAIQSEMPDINTSQRVHVVQHGAWNEKVTSPESLELVKKNTDYHMIPDGNTVGNGSPGFRDPEYTHWKSKLSNPKLIEIWQLAVDIANEYNGKDGRYNNTAISSGGLDFSDLSAVCWILGLHNDIKDTEDFFNRFSD